MSAVFVFNASLNDVAPASPASLSVVVKRKEPSELFMDVFCVCLPSFVFTPQIEYPQCCV